ncbi:MAG: transporter substrate-binding domain-containing protein [Deltaproteobacteria bacterium]
MRLNYKKGLSISCSIIWLCLLLFLPANAFSRDDSTAARRLIVGVIVAPPLYMKTADGQWEGFSIDMWRAVAQHMGVSSEFRQYNSLEALLAALENGEIDVIPSLPAELRYEVTMDLSQSYYKSGLAIAVPAEGAGYRWIGVIAKIFSADILMALGLLLLMCLAAGIIVCLFESRHNREMFGEGIAKSIGQGIWWSIVTMTTVGYGDKAPKTTGGRTVAIIWMLFSIVFIAAFTAKITTSLTIGELQGKVRGFHDLYHARVGSISQSEAAIFLTNHGIAVMPFESVQEGLKDLAAKKIDAFVLNELVLKYLVKKKFPGRLQVLPAIFDEYFVVIALKEKSSLRKLINIALLKVMKTEKWSELLNRYAK